MGRKIHVKKKVTKLQTKAEPKAIESKKEVRIKSVFKPENYLKVCPKCHSSKIQKIKSENPQLPPQFKCQKCKYTSFFFSETTKSELKKKKKTTRK